MGSMRILIKGGKVVNDDFTQEADVYIENGIIQQVDHIYVHKQISFYMHPTHSHKTPHTLKHILHDPPPHRQPHTLTHIHSPVCPSV